MSTRTLKVTRVAGTNDLFFPDRFTGKPASTFLLINFDDAELSAMWWPMDGLPTRVLAGRALFIEIPCLTSDAANRLLDRATPYAQRILSGFIDLSAWAGDLSPAAQVAVQELQAMVDGTPWRDEDKVSLQQYPNHPEYANAEVTGGSADTWTARCRAMLQAIGVRRRTATRKAAS